MALTELLHSRCCSAQPETGERKKDVSLRRDFRILKKKKKIQSETRYLKNSQIQKCLLLNDNTSWFFYFNERHGTWYFLIMMILIIIIVIILVSGFRMQCTWAYVEASIFRINLPMKSHSPLWSVCSFLTLIIWSLPKLLPGSCLSM